MARTFSECGAREFMSDKLFEYKDSQDWYIAQWGEDADYNQFSHVPTEASTLLDQLELLFAKDPEGFPLNADG